MTATEDATSPNFSFLAKRYPELEQIAARSERYFSGDPIVSLSPFDSSVRHWRNSWRRAPVCTPTRRSASAICSDVSASTGRYPSNVLGELATVPRAGGSGV